MYTPLPTNAWLIQVFLLQWKRYEAILIIGILPLQTILPIIFTYFPAGSSLKAWTHYSQLMRSGVYVCLFV
jgi:hypothetical protein